MPETWGCTRENEVKPVISAISFVRCVCLDPMLLVLGGSYLLTLLLKEVVAVDLCKL